MLIEPRGTCDTIDPLPSDAMTPVPEPNGILITVKEAMQTKKSASGTPEPVDRREGLSVNASYGVLCCRPPPPPPKRRYTRSNDPRTK